MPDDTQVAKWGNSLAVRIPQAIVKEARLAVVS
jgi:antitoxin component of MazEF toxin-antitoxin module